MIILVILSVPILCGCIIGVRDMARDYARRHSSLFLV